MAGFAHSGGLAVISFQIVSLHGSLADHGSSSVFSRGIE
jgi:hypothetical protein